MFSASVFHIPLIHPGCSSLRACLKNAFHEMYPKGLIYFTVYGKFIPDSGDVPKGPDTTGYIDQIRDKWSVNRGVQIMGMIFRTRSKVFTWSKNRFWKKQKVYTIPSPEISVSVNRDFLSASLKVSSFTFILLPGRSHFCFIKRSSCQHRKIKQHGGQNDNAKIPLWWIRCKTNPLCAKVSRNIGSRKQYYSVRPDRNIRLIS